MEMEFIPPPEAPVFEPTIEEFADPLAYITKIRPIGEKTGIIKIKPPPEWQPPFAVDVDTFRFTPRIQKLNELEALSRIKLNFLDAVAKFWDLQGTSLRVPNVERKALDLYVLHKIVNEEGGFEVVTRERRWSRVAHRMNFPGGKGVGSVLRQHYERMLYPYDLFKAGVTVDPERVRVTVKTEVDEDNKKLDKDYKPKHAKTPTKDPEGCRRSKRVVKEEPYVDYTANSELKKLQFFGAGPKTALPNMPVKKEEELDEDMMEISTRRKVKGRSKGMHLIDTYMCHSCGSGDIEEQMLLCDNCDDAFHTFCLVPPLPEIPKGDWRCPRCVAEACNKPKEAYGFDQSSKTYSLQEFGEKADDFKAHYFNMPVHMVPYDMVESEFWTLVNSLEDDVVVEYGADIHAIEMGSGFPTKDTEDHFPEDEEYINSPWNLNNIALQDKSVLGHVNADISGMKIPWCYVGMCFSCFAWHVEDHWSYSINYMHWGEPKTWYGVPGAQAEDLEEVMKKQAGELFVQAPDLLHHITTIMNPNILMEHGVPVVRTNQCAGEFVITFPRAYHAGFNQGYNFAEAVNFCPSDWLPIGRACIEHYRSLKRQLVFSHEELICKMAADPDGLDLMMAAATYEDMLAMVENEKKMRKALLDMGITEAEREAFELLPDDEKQCNHCKTTCFLSAITCPCNPNNLVCIHHVEELCDCPTSRLCLRYRYTLDELPAMLHRLKVRAESFDTWANKVKNALEACHGQKLDFSEVKALVTEAEVKKFPDSELLQTLRQAIREAEKCVNVAAQLVSKKARTRHRQSGETKYIAKLTLEELEQFLDQVKSLPCVLKEATLIQDLLTKVKDYQSEAVLALDEEMPNSEKLNKLVEFGVTLDVDLPEIPRLKQVLRQAHWLDDVRNTLTESLEVTLESMRKMLDSGVSLAPHRAVEKAMAELQELLTISERWEEKARICLQARPRHVITTLEAIINEAKGIPAYLPNVAALKEALKKAKEWTAKVDSVQTGEHYPYLDVLENLVNRGRPIPVRLDQLPQVESQVAAAKSWRERTARTFLKKNSSYSLVEVLSPRSDIGIYSSSKNRRKKIKEADKDKENINGDAKLEEYRDPASMVACFKAAEQTEIDAMRALRAKCMEKHRQEDAQEQKYCVCRKTPSGFMLQCELCKDWFHGNCVPLPKSTNLKNKASQAAAVQAAKELKFLCPLCLRSRRPRLETILSLLVSLQKLPVRLPEGEALQCLTERAMAWQDRARQALATDELASALAKLSVLSQKMVEQAAREKTEKIINAELLKAACNPELQGHLQSVTQSAFGSGQANSVVTVMDIETSGGQEEKAEEEAEEAQMEAEIVQTLGTGMSEHAYSSASKGNLGIAAQSPRKHQRKSPLVPRQLETPVLELSDMARAQLEELMMEGDLLEVSLDETQHIWRILQACSSKAEEKFMEFENSELPEHNKEKPLKEKDGERKKKKRKKEKDEEGGKSEEKTKKKKLKHKDKEHKESKEKDKVKVKEEKKENVGKEKDKEKKKKKKRPDGEKRSKTKQSASGNNVAADDEDDSEDCSAAKCLKPTGDEVNWVQCDTCELWFHLLCVGLSEEEVAGNEDYSCYTCRNKDSDLPPVLTPHISLLNCNQGNQNKEDTAPEIHLVEDVPVADANVDANADMVDEVQEKTEAISIDCNKKGEGSSEDPKTPDADVESPKTAEVSIDSLKTTDVSIEDAKIKEVNIEVKKSEVYIENLEKTETVIESVQKREANIESLKSTGDIGIEAPEKMEIDLTESEKDSEQADTTAMHMVINGVPEEAPSLCMESAIPVSRDQGVTET